MDITLWDKIPEEMQLYLSRNGKHFNKRLCEFAVMHMHGRDDSEPYTREQTEKMLLDAGFNIADYDAPYDAVYLANMAKNDFLGSSIEDAKHVARFINDTLTDIDGYEGMVFNRWIADVSGKGVWVDWERMV